MCLLALFFRVAEDAPVVVGANREEWYRRGGEPPRLLSGTLQALAGVDPVAGGTWLGVNERGVVVAVTNRHKSHVPDQPRSRGLLTRYLLHESTSARLGVDLATQELASNPFAGCNFLLADAHDAWVIHAGDWLRVRPLPPGLHVLTNGDLNDANDPRLNHVGWWISQHRCHHSSHCLKALQQVCGQTGPETPPICFRDAERGTVSSSVLALTRDPERAVYLHAPGPPDRTAYEDYSPLLQELLTCEAGAGKTRR